MNKFLKILILISSIIIFPSVSKSMDSPDAILYDVIVPELYQNESDFTQVPSLVAGLTFTIPAFIVGGVGYTFGYAIGYPADKEKDFAQNSAFWLGFVTVRLGSTIVGLPFYVIEKTLWDFPKWLFFPKNRIR